MVKTWITRNHDWYETIFSDEKRFTLDGPNNWVTCFGSGVRIKRKRRQCKEDGVMVWLVLMPNGLMLHKIIKDKFESQNYY